MRDRGKKIASTITWRWKNSCRTEPMEDSKLISFQNRLTKVYRHVGRQAKRMGIECFRVYDHDLPEFPFCIEVYGRKIYVAEYRRRHGMSEAEYESWLASSRAVIRNVFQVNDEDVYFKLRQVKQGRGGQYRKLDTRSGEFTVHEGGLQFIVNLSDYLDTGLFLDHRVTRGLVRSQSPGRKLLNLFCYTGSFSVYAAAGGAVSIESVDLSNTYLDWCRRNMELNGFSGPAFSYRQADVKQYLRGQPAGLFDIIVLDPPTFSNSQRMSDVLDIQRDHVELINGCLRRLAPGGVIYFSTNLRTFALDRNGVSANDITDITRATTPFDFEGRLQRFCFRIAQG